MKQTQENKVLAQLKEYGYVTRNWALSNYISRLSGIIHSLEKDGYVFDAYYTDDKDYMYTLVASPLKSIQQVEIKDGKAIISYKFEPIIKVQQRLL